MTTDEKLAAILATVQTDPGNRGLARDPDDNLFTATKGDFQAACRSIAEAASRRVQILTGFAIPHEHGATFETDGPLGAVFLYRAFHQLEAGANIVGEGPIIRAAGIAVTGFARDFPFAPEYMVPTHVVWIERAGPAADGKHYTMRGRDTTGFLDSRYGTKYADTPTIGIGDGGNEIGMGKIPHETIVKNIPNGDLIHCRVPTDHLIVAGVSNWGAYALAAGIFVLRGVKPPTDLFDPDRERQILEVMVREGPLVDGVTGQQTATVDGLTWDEYAKPLVRIREILES